MKEVGQLIKKRRKELNITQQQLAQKLKMTQSAISQIEKGMITISFALLYKIADVLGTTPSYFFIHERTYSDEVERVGDVLLQLQRYYLNHQYTEMKELLDEVKEEPIFKEPQHKPLLMLWEAKYHFQSFQLDEGLFLCFSILDDFEPYLSRFNLGDLHRVIADLFSGHAILLEQDQLSCANNPKCLTYLQEAVQHYHLALQQLRVEHQTSEVYKKVLYGIGSAYHRMGELTLAEKYYQQCIEMCHKDQKLSVSYEANIFVMKGLHYMEEGKYDESLRMMERAQDMYTSIQEHRNIMTCLMNKAKAYEGKGETEKAIRQYQDLKNYMEHHREWERKDYWNFLEEKLASTPTN